MEHTIQQLKIGKALAAYNALMRWFDRAANTQISGEDSVKCMLWLDNLLKVIMEHSDYKYASDNSKDLWSIALKDIKLRLEKIKKGANKKNE